MLSLFIGLLTAVACGVVNALRGSGYGWMRPLVGAVAGAGHFLIAWEPLAALTIAGGVWIWLSQPWGRWYTLGNHPRELSGVPNDYERVLERVADAVFRRQRDFADATAWFISGTIFGLPLAFLSSLAWLALTPAAVGLYWLAWSLEDRWQLESPVRLGEFWTACAIGAIAAGLAMA